MLQPHQVEDLICVVSAMERPALVHQFQAYRSTFPLDFTPEFLETVSLDRLRHIFVALCLQCQRVPELVPPTAQPLDWAVSAVTSICRPPCYSDR